MQKRKILGLILLIFSIFIIPFNRKFTGAIIGAKISMGINVISIILLVIAIILLTKFNLERNLAQETLRSGAVITDPKKIIKIARKMGYDSGREVKEGYQVLNHGKPLTVIPRHRVSQGAYRKIMKSLSSGESNFRRYDKSA